MYIHLQQILHKLTSFQFYISIPFWGAFVLAVLIFRIVGTTTRAARWSVLMLSALMVMALPRFTYISLISLVLVSCIAFAGGSLLVGRLREARRDVRIFCATSLVILIIFVLAISKYRFFQKIVLGKSYLSSTDISKTLFIVGISYASFKMMHFVIECYKKNIEKQDLSSFMNFIFFFPSFISGPINRFDHFRDQLVGSSKEGTLIDDAKEGGFRIVNGILKKVVVATLIEPYIIINVIQTDQLSFQRLLLGVYAYTIYFYVDFSGYSDMAIGSARIMGISLPENFNNPFLKKNIQELWANWHISLTSWLTDYIYWPLVRRLRKNSTFQNKPILLSNICIIVTFLICGMWHGDTINFLLWGLYHGIGIAVVNTYRSYKRKIKSPILRRYFASSGSKIVGIVATFNFFAIGIVLFALTPETISTIMRR